MWRRGEKMKMTGMIIPFLVFISVGVFAAEEGMVYHGNPGPDSDLIFRLVNFAILMGLLFFLLRKPVKEHFASRSKQIRTAIEEARGAYSRAMQENKDILKRLENIEQETQALLKMFREEGEKERENILGNARQFALRLKTDAKKITEAEVLKARAELKQAAIHLSRDLAEKMIRDGVNDNDERRLTDNYLRRLKTVH